MSSSLLAQIAVLLSTMPAASSQVCGSDRLAYGASGVALLQKTRTLTSETAAQDQDADCSKLVVTIRSKTDHIHVSDECLDHDFDETKKVECDRQELPMTCTFPLKLMNNSASALTPDKADTGEVSANEPIGLSELEVAQRGKRKIKGKHDEQYQWAGRMFVKLAMIHESCKPKTQMKAPVRHMDCRVCWALWQPYPCDCDCRGWNQVANLCSQPCSAIGNGEFSHDTGHYCHKPCDRDGQLALQVGCGLGDARVCVASDGACRQNIADKVWSIADVAIFVGTLGASGPVKIGFQAGARAGVKAMKKAFKETANTLVTKATRNAYVKKQMKGLKSDLQQKILEEGAAMFLSSVLAFMSDDYEAIALEIAAVVDPTGLVGLYKSFKPPKDCDHMTYFNEPLPKEGVGPDLDALDETLTRTQDFEKGVSCNGRSQYAGYMSLDSCWEHCSNDEECVAWGYNSILASQLLFKDNSECFFYFECDSTRSSPFYTLYYKAK